MNRQRIALAALATVLLSFTGASAQSDYTGKKFPTFDAKDAITGKRFTLEDLRGKVVVIDFWATWCGPCVRELPNVKAVHEKYKDRGLEIVGISLDNDRNKFKSFVESRGMNWRHVMDGGMWKTRLAKKYGINSIPRMMVIDHEGVCVANKVWGPQLDAAVDRAIKKAEAAAKNKPPVEDKLAADGAEPESSESKAAAADAAILDADLVNALSRKLDAAHQQVTIAGAPLAQLSNRIREAGQTVAAIEANLPSPAQPASTRAAYGQLLEQLVALRRDLFAVGRLNSGLVALPADVFAEESRGNDSRAFFRAHQQLELAKSALAQFERAIAGETSTATALVKRLSHLGEQIRTGKGEATEVQARCDDLCSSVAELSARWRDPWRAQLDKLPMIAANLCRLDESSPYAALNEKIASLQQRSSALNLDDATFNSLRDEFGHICAALTAVQQRPSSARAIKLPVNPLERRTARDRSALAQLDVQLRVAGEAVAQLERENASGKDAAPAIDPLLAQVKSLQEELAETESDPSALNGIETRFVVLCGDLLAALD